MFQVENKTFNFSTSYQKLLQQPPEQVFSSRRVLATPGTEQAAIFGTIQVYMVGRAER